MSQQIDMDAVIEELRKGWVKGELDTGYGVCLLGALDRVRAQFDIHKRNAGKSLETVVSEQFPDRLLTGNQELCPVARFNDHPDTLLDDVLLVCEKARAAQGECHE